MNLVLFSDVYEISVFMKPVIDDFDFPRIWDDTAELNLRDEYEKKKKQSEKKWEQYMRKRDESEPFSREDRKLKALIRTGIPAELRAEIWTQLSGVSTQMEVLPDLYRQLGEGDGVVTQAVLRVIDQDVARTFSKTECVDHEALRRILIGYANLRIEIGYCQSMSYIAAILLAVVGEEKAFWMLDFIISSFPPDYYSGRMSSYQTDLKVVLQLIEERVPKLWQLAQRLEFDFLTAVSGWLLSMFTLNLPVPTVLRIWDVFFFEGPKILFRTIIGLLRKFEPYLLKARDLNDFTRMVNVLMRNGIDADGILEEAFKIRSFSREHIAQIRRELVDENGDGTVHSAFPLQYLWGRLGI